MHLKYRSLLTVAVLAVSQPIYASAQNLDTMKDIKKYLGNLGKYLGYNITENYCPGDKGCTPYYNQGHLTEPEVKSALLETGNIGEAQFSLYSSYLGTLLGGSDSQTANPIVPGTESIINSWSGQTYPSYASQSSDKVSVSGILDQQTFQADPVSQSILNMMSTPNYSYCVYSENSGQGYGAQKTSCNLLFREKVLYGVVGELPNGKDVFSPDYNLSLISQLNSDVLLMPLLYTNKPSSQPQQGNNQTTAASASGLTALTQAQKAANFIRYASGLVNPIDLPSQSTYEDLVGTALNYKEIKNLTPQEQQQQLAAQSILSEYLTKLRVYTAQTSVGISNLYSILSKRLPQPAQENPMKNADGTSNSSLTSKATGSQNDSSEALNEFIMASWRLFDSNKKSDGDGQWLSKINKGSSASVEKEIAVLLAEINYQLYLTRQQNERMLLTQSVMLLQSARSALPSPQLTQTVNDSKASGGLE